MGIQLIWQLYPLNPAPCMVINAYIEWHKILAIYICTCICRWFRRICSNCLEDCIAPLPCEGCAIVSFCSTQCRLHQFILKHRVASWQFRRQRILSIFSSWGKTKVKSCTQFFFKPLLEKARLKYGPSRRADTECMEELECRV